MGKFTISASKDSIPQLLASIEAEFKFKPFATYNLDTMKRAAEEIVLAIANVDSECGPIIIDFDINYGGTSAQFLHAGPIFNPCDTTNNHCPFTTNEMDEISFEFKYGHSVVAIHKKLPLLNA